MGLEYAILLCVTKAGIQRHDFQKTANVPPQIVCHLTNVAFTGQKHQNIPTTESLRLFALPLQNVFNRLQNPAFHPAFFISNRVLVRLFNVIQRPIHQFHRIGTPGHFDYRRIMEIRCKTHVVDRGGGDHHFQIRSFGKELLQITQQKINIQRTFVGFIYNNCTVLTQKTVMVDFSQQNTVGHQFDDTGIGNPILETDFKTNCFTQR